MITVDPRRKEIKNVLVGKHPLWSLFHNVSVVEKKLSEWNFFVLMEGNKDDLSQYTWH